MKNQKFVLLAVLLYIAPLAFSQVKISGKITDEKSSPLPNISVHLLNTNNGAVTAEDGSYTLSGILRGKYILQFSSIGFALQNREIVVGSADINLPVTLHQSGTSLDEIVVTAQKNEEILQKLPISITAISAEEVNEFRLWNSREMTAIIPNLYSADPGDKRNTTSIRGITTTSYDPAVATYIDGVNQFSLDTYISPLFDIERIEVLRGPQGTLYGRNAMGGVINIITKQPTNKTDVFAEISIGNHGSQRYSAGFKAPLVKNKLFFGAAGLYDGINGYYTNEFNNSKYDKQHSIVGNYYLKYEANDRWAITLNAKHNNNRNTGPFPLVFGIDEAFQNPYKLNQNALTKIIDNSFNSSLSVNFTGRKFNMQSQTAYLYNYRYYNSPIDADFSPIDGVTLNNDFGKDWNNVKVVTEEIKFTSPAGSASSLKWIAGTYLFYQESPTKTDTHFGNDGALVGAPDNNFSLINSAKAKGIGVAFYGQLTYALTEKLRLTGGLRYDNEYKKLDILGEYQKNPDPAFTIVPDTSANATFNALTPKFGMDYDIAANHLLFVSYSKGFRAGGLTPVSSDPSQPALFSFKPEYSNNVEVGLKNSFFENKLYLNLSAFYTTVTDAQVPTLVLPEAITVTRNTGLLHSKGAELELSAIPAKGIEIFYNAGYTNAEYKTLKLSQNGNEVDLKGKRAVFTPEYTSMVALQYSYSFPNNSLNKIFVRGELKSVGRQYFDLANTLTQDAYSLVNTSAGFKSKDFQFIFWTRNLTGKKYISYAYDFGAVHLGDPSVYGFTFRVNNTF